MEIVHVFVVVQMKKILNDSEENKSFFEKFYIVVFVIL